VWRKLLRVRLRGSLSELPAKAVSELVAYHTPLDTAEKVDFTRMARVVEGVRRVVESLAFAK
jgi:hypothetical protein